MTEHADNNSASVQNHSGEESLQTIIVYDKEDDKGRITINETVDKTKAFIKLSSTSSQKKYSKDYILSILNELSINTGVRDKVVDITLAHLYKKTYSTTDLLLIAEGRTPVHGINGSCEVLFDQKKPFVEKDQPLIRLTEPSVGKPGLDIYGNMVQPTPGKSAKITVSENVYKKKGNEFCSNIIGTASFKDNVLSVQKTLDIHVSEDRMQGTLTYTGEAQLDEKKIIDELHIKNIHHGIDHKNIDFIVKTFNAKGEPVINFPVANGTPIQEGRDGEITFLIETDTEPSYKENEDGSIDIRETGITQSVSEDTELAFMVPHVDPVPGKDISGKVLPVQPVKKPTLKAGKNIRVSGDGIHFFAASSGRPIVEEGPLESKISVNEVFSISRDLNLAVGNIDFDGVVEIGGDVEDGFKVKASKSILIKGLVGASEVEAGLDIQINGGCNGKGTSTIVCGRNLTARYLNEVSVVSKGDIIVINEIVNCDIQTLGRVIVKNGSIRGGTITAKKGIEGLHFGSDMGVKTVLIPGKDYELAEQCREIEDKIIKINNELTDINKRIAPLLKNKELIAQLPQEQREKLKETINYLKQLKADKETYNTEKNDLIDAAMQDAIGEVVAFGYVYQGVILKILQSRREIASVIEGPLRLYEENERISVEPYSANDKSKKYQTDSSKQTVGV